MKRNLKQHLRNRFRRNRKRLRSRFHKKLSRRILAHLQAILQRGPGSIPLKILFYWPIHSEVDLRTLPLWCPNHQFYLPHSFKGGDMEILRYSEGDELKSDANGIPSPVSQEDCLHPEELDLALIPGIGFDTRGRRLGYGKGYYDRLLEGRTVPTLGIGFDFQIQKSALPESKSDVVLDALLTEEGLLRVNGEFPYGYSNP